MTAGRRPEPRLDAWFAERAAMLHEPREGFEEMLAMAAATPQRRHRWWPFTTGANAPPRLGVLLSTTVAVLVLGFAFSLLAFGLLGGPADPSDPAQLPAAVVSPSASVAPTEVTEAPSTEEVEPTDDAATTAAERFAATVARLETEPVAPGVLRVIADDVGHTLTKVDDFAIGSDGRIWMVRKGDRLIELGAPGSYRGADGLPPHLARVLPGSEGLPLVVGDDEERGRVVALPDGQRWGPRIATAPDPRYEAPPTRVARTSDGRTWFVTPEGRLARVAGADHELAHSPEGMGIDWPESFDPTASTFLGIEPASDGSLWALLVGSQDVAAPQLVRFDGDAWQLMSPPEWQEPDRQGFRWVARLLAGPDGSMWVPFSVDSAGARDYRLAHWGTDEWAVVDAPSCDFDIGWGRPGCPMAVDPDGRIWYLRGDEPWSYDGATWSRLEAALSDSRGMNAAPDGTLWVVGGSASYILDPRQVGDEGGDDE